MHEQVPGTKPSSTLADGLMLSLIAAIYPSYRRLAILSPSPPAALVDSLEISRPFHVLTFIAPILSIENLQW